MGLLWWLSGKESACQCRRCKFNPWVRKIPWRRKWQPTPVFLSGKFHEQRSLAGYSPWSYKRVGHHLVIKQLLHADANESTNCRTLNNLWGLYQCQFPGLGTELELQKMIYHWGKQGRMQEISLYYFFFLQLLMNL